MEVTIKGKEVQIRHTFKAEIIFETAENHTFNGTSTKDWITMFFCSVISSSSDDGWLTFSEFIDWLDEDGNEGSLYDFIESYTTHAVAMSEMRKAKEEPADKSKKSKGAKKK